MDFSRVNYISSKLLEYDFVEFQDLKAKIDGLKQCHHVVCLKSRHSLNIAVVKETYK